MMSEQNRKVPGSVGELQGLWRRSLMAWPDMPEDRTTWVSWLQGPSLYADLRQPAGKPDFSGVRCLRDLEIEQIRWMAGQMAFAGTFQCEGKLFSWGHDLDYGPLSPTPDRAFLWFEHDRLVERGQEIPFTEHWHRSGGASRISGAALLKDREGRSAILVRDGEHFLIANSYDGPAYRAETLSLCIEMATGIVEMQDMVGSEFSFGKISEAGWLIERSSLPFREGADLHPVFRANGVRLSRITPDGAPFDHEWVVEFSEGCLYANI